MANMSTITVTTRVRIKDLAIIASHMRRKGLLTTTKSGVVSTAVKSLALTIVEAEWASKPQSDEEANEILISLLRESSGCAVLTTLPHDIVDSTIDHMRAVPPTSEELDDGRVDEIRALFEQAGPNK